jgi:hypothetical protein
MTSSYTTNPSNQIAIETELNFFFLGKGIMTVTQKGCVITSSVALSEKDGAKLITYFRYIKLVQK